MIRNSAKHLDLRIVHVAAIQGTFKLFVGWDNGDKAVLDYAPLITSHHALEPLTDPKLFGSVRVRDDGDEIIWTDDINGGSDSLRQLADEQHAVIQRKKTG